MEEQKESSQDLFLKKQKTIAKFPKLRINPILSVNSQSILVEVLSYLPK